jgi:hypothetical protein
LLYRSEKIVLSKRIVSDFSKNILKEIFDLSWAVERNCRAELAELGNKLAELCLAGSRIQNLPNFFRSGGAVLAKISVAERSGGAVTSKKFGAEKSGGAEISEIFDFLVFFMKFSRKIAQKGPNRSQITPGALARRCLGTFLKNIKCKTRFVSKNLSGAERSRGAEF